MTRATTTLTRAGVPECDALLTGAGEREVWLRVVSHLPKQTSPQTTLEPSA